MKELSAKDARLISDKAKTLEIEDVLNDIEYEAGRGEYKLDVKKYLKPETIQGLIARGFEVNPQSPISIQVDNLYYIIKW